MSDTNISNASSTPYWVRVLHSPSTRQGAAAALAGFLVSCLLEAVSPSS